VKVKVTGAAQKIGQIQRFRQDIWKDMQKEVKSAAQLVANDAKGRIPGQGLSNWGAWTDYKSKRDLSFGSSAASGITVSFRSKEIQGFRRIKAKVGFSKGNAAGAIYSLAGSKPGTLSTHPAGAARSAGFKRAINRKFGGSFTTRNSQQWPRALTPAFYAKGPQARIKIGQAVERAVAKVNK
jgi:hypothetical protein